MIDDLLSDEQLYQAAFERIRSASTVEAGVHAFRDECGLEHVTYHLVYSVMNEMQADSPFVRTTYPPEWVARYLLKGYVHVDPVLKEGMQRSLPFEWHETEQNSDAQAMLADFASFGLSLRGLSIPIVDRAGRRALVSLSSSQSEPEWIADLALFKRNWIDLAHVLHKKAICECFGNDDPAPALSPREIETLRWTAKGKDYKEIAAIMEISEHTIRAYMRSARFKLDCSNLTQAVAKAVHMRLISL